jgi:hypothetical protein
VRRLCTPNPAPVSRTMERARVSPKALRGQCQCGAWIDLAERAPNDWTAPAHRCGRGAGPAAPPTAAAPSSRTKPVRAAVARSGAQPTRPSSDEPFAPLARLRAGELRLWLPRVPRSDEGPNGRSWRRKARGAHEWRELTIRAIGTLAARPRWEAVRISYVVFGANGRVADRDNLVVAVGKPVQDALVQGGVLPDDGPAVVVATPAVEQRPSPLPFGFVAVSVRRMEARIPPAGESQVPGEVARERVAAPGHRGGDARNEP